MKTTILLFLFCCFSFSAFSQSYTFIYASGAAGSYITGSATSTTRTDGTIICTSTTQNGYAVFDLSSIPVGSVINSCAIVFYTSTYTAGVDGPCNTYGYAGDLSIVTDPIALFTDITSGTLLFSATSPVYGSYTALSTIDSLASATAPVTTFMQANIGSKISIGFSGGGTSVYNFTGETGTPGLGPHLNISYTSPCTGAPGIGIITAVRSSACPASNDTLNYTDYSTHVGITFQWQSSPDSATWSNISGATTATYIISGFAATTYYRIFNTCTFSGLSDTTAGMKITYAATCCSGTPAVGVATASATSCSSCSLTVGLSGYPVSAGLTYQWQSSPDNVTWTNIWAATSMPYTFSPVGAYYYRCTVTCGFSGLSSYSSSVFVSYQYHIIADSVINPSPGTCTDPVFYTEINGSSNLLFLKTCYGDGSKDSIEGPVDSTTSKIYTPHAYTAPGIYSIKQVLYYNNIPQDSDKYNYTYQLCNTFPIWIYLDEDADCVKSDTDPYYNLPLKVQVDSSGIPIATLSATSCIYYVAHGPVGTIYSFSILSVPGNTYVSCPSSGTLYDTVQSSSSTYSYKYFGLHCSPGSAFDLSVYDVIYATGQFDQSGNIYVSNTYCAPQNAVVSLHYSKYYNVVRSTGLNVSPTPASYTDSTITWNLSDLYAGAGNEPIDLFYAVYSENGCCGVLNPGLAIPDYIAVTPTVGDVDTLNNYDIVIDTVKAGTDPNEMSVSPSGCIADTVTQLQYTIKFTNVGNDTAFNIHAMDTLSNNVDPKSLKLLMSSNTMGTAMLNDGVNNIVKFDFPAINLLDSTACPRCSGSVIFTVKTLPGLPTGTTIFNHAGVFFDYNPVVMTNTVEDIMGGCTNASVSNVHSAGTDVQVFPNPANNTLNIQMSPGAYTSFTIINSIGQQMIQQPLSLSQTNVNVATLPAGLYYIAFRGDNGTNVQKFVKM